MLYPVSDDGGEILRIGCWILDICTLNKKGATHETIFTNQFARRRFA
jgi:hypothetical protein